MIADGCVIGMSRVRWMSRTSGRSLARFPFKDARVKEPAFCNNLAKGRVDRSDSSTSMSSCDAEDPDEADDLLLRLAGLSERSAHSGVGLSLSNC